MQTPIGMNISDDEMDDIGRTVPNLRTSPSSVQEPRLVIDSPQAASPAAALIGMPALIAASAAFAFSVSSYAPVGALIPLLTIAVVGDTIAARWSAVQGAASLTGIFAAFAGFWFSYVLLILGLANDWFGIAPAGTIGALSIFLVSWLSVMLLMAVVSLDLPWPYTLLLVLFAIALALLLVGTLTSTQGWFIAAGAVLFSQTAIGVYIAVATLGPARLREVLPIGSGILGARSRPTMSEQAGETAPARRTASSTTNEHGDVDQAENQVRRVSDPHEPSGDTNEAAGANP